MKFIKHLKQNSRITLALAVFALVIIPLFVAYWIISDGWDRSYTYALILPVVLLSIALVYDYVKFKRIKK
jgi:peptidoglycan/LPS O-acetylase OafA/YrhL